MRRPGRSRRRSSGRSRRIPTRSASALALIAYLHAAEATRRRRSRRRRRRRRRFPRRSADPGGARRRAARGGRDQSGARDVHAAAKLQPENPTPLLRLAGVQVDIKDYDGGDRSLRKALALQPDQRAGVGRAGQRLHACPVVSSDGDRRCAQAAEGAARQRAVGFAVEGELLVAQKKWAEAAAAYRDGARAATDARFSLPAPLRGAARRRQDGRRDGVRASNGARSIRRTSRCGTSSAQQSWRSKDYPAAARAVSGGAGSGARQRRALNNLAWVLSELGDPKARRIRGARLRAGAVQRRMSSIRWLDPGAARRHGAAASQLLRKAIESRAATNARSACISRRR